MPAEDELFSAVDALLEQVAQDELPAPAERKRLREAAGLSQAGIVKALDIRWAAVGDWESGKTEPRQPKRAAYARLLKDLAARFPAPAAGSAPTAPEPSPPPSPPRRGLRPGPGPFPRAESAAARGDRRTGHDPATRRGPGAAGPSAPTIRIAAPGRDGTGGGGGRDHRRHPDAHHAVDPRFAHGPLAVVDVVDGQVWAYCAGGLILDIPAKSLPSLVGWTLAEARLGAPRLNRNGRDADPVLVLTDAAAVRFGPPARLTDEERPRHLTQALPPQCAARLFDAQEQGAPEQRLLDIAAEVLQEIYFQGPRPPRPGPAGGVHRHRLHRGRPVRSGMTRPGARAGSIS
ncbi:helix-turn-helix transcriptional regulator [Streptomyces antimycoticus]|uniref:helix-turn-helix transcriptional regulator n=2 Tax=Streptomyces TaxID=1883 RepID=UPI00191BA391